jgi:hypothetical protein
MTDLREHLRDIEGLSAPDLWRSVTLPKVRIFGLRQ